VPEIREFDFGKDEIIITLGEDLGFITLDRNEGVLTFETKLRKLDVRLVEGAKFFLGEAAGYSDCVYLRLEMPPGYGPIRSLGRVKKDSQDGKLFVDVANICVPQSQPVLRSEADVPPARRKVMRLALSVLLLAIAVGIFYYWISYRDAVRRRANLTAEAMAAYNRYHENLPFAPPFYDRPGPENISYTGFMSTAEMVQSIIGISLHRGRPRGRKEFIEITVSDANKITSLHKLVCEKSLEAGKILEARDFGLALIVFGQDYLLVCPHCARRATLMQLAGIIAVKKFLKESEDREAIDETGAYLTVLTKTQPMLPSTVYGIRVNTEYECIEFSQPLGFISKSTGKKSSAVDYNLIDFVHDWESYSEIMSEIEAVFRKPLPEIQKKLPEVDRKFMKLSDFFISVETDPTGLPESFDKMRQAFDSVIKTAEERKQELKQGK
jgi:hypothetical protein